MTRSDMIRSEMTRSEMTRSEMNWTFAISPVPPDYTADEAFHLDLVCLFEYSGPVNTISWRYYAGYMVFIGGRPGPVTDYPSQSNAMAAAIAVIERRQNA